MDAGMERLHPTPEDLGASGVLGDLARGKARILEGLEGSTGAEELKSEVDETTGEGDEPPLVRDAEESDHGSCEG
jgi:hypothetical protein